MSEKRGLNATEAAAYLGVKRRAFNEQWRPHLIAQRHGSSVIFDRHDLDRLFDQFKQKALDEARPAANDAPTTREQNGSRNGRPTNQKGWIRSWAKKPGASTPKQTGPGKSTSGGAVLDFASVASQILKKPTAG